MRHISYSGIFPILQTLFNEKEEIVFEVLKTVVDQSDGRVSIIMNTSEESSHYTTYLSEKAQDLGASGLMIKPPMFDQAPQNSIENHFIKVAESVNIPIFMQDQGNSPISGEFAIRLSNANENLSYIKLESIPTIPRFDYCNTNSSREKLILFGGVGESFFLEELRRGSSGTMPSSVLPDVFVKTWDLWNEGKQEEAQDYLIEFAELLKILSQGLGLSSWINKYVLYRRGVIKQESSYARIPGLQPTSMHLKEIDRILETTQLV